MALGGVTYLATAEKPSATGFGASMAAGVGGAFLDSSLGVIGKSLDDTSFMPRSFANSATDRLQDAAVTQRLQNTSLALFGGFISSLGTDATSYWAQKIALEVK